MDIPNSLLCKSCKFPAFPTFPTCFMENQVTHHMIQEHLIIGTLSQFLIVDLYESRAIFPHWADVQVHSVHDTCLRIQSARDISDVTTCYRVWSWSGAHSSVMFHSCKVSAVGCHCLVESLIVTIVSAGGCNFHYDVQSEPTIFSMWTV